MSHGPLAVIGAVYENADWYFERRVRLLDEHGRAEVLTNPIPGDTTVRLKLRDGYLHRRWKRVEDPRDQSGASR